MACEFVVIGGSLSEHEQAAYLARAKERHGREPLRITARLDGDFVDLDYDFGTRPFERIRRITGYLVGTLDRFNDGKRAEEHDRVKHELKNKQALERQSHEHAETVSL